MPLIDYDGSKPTVGGSEDTWGTTINGALDDIKSSLDNLASCATARILGRDTAGTGDFEQLTGTEATALLVAVDGADQSNAGVKGLVPAPAAGDQYKALAGDGTWRYGPGRKAGCIITTTGVNGSTPTLSGAWNVASLANVVNGGGALASTVITFTDALPDTAYAVHVQANGSDNTTSYGSKTTTTVQVIWQPTGVTELSVSIF